MPPAKDRRAGDRTILVLDPESMHSLATVRALGRAGWRVVVAGARPRMTAIAAGSRYVERYRRIPDPWGPRDPAIAALRSIVARDGCRVVIPIYDGTIARLRDANLGVPTVPALDDALDALIDKVRLAGVCRAAGIMYPTTWAPDDGVPPPVAWPLVVKPRQTAVADAAGVMSRTGAFVVETASELDAAMGAIREAGLQPIVQPRVQRAFKVNVSVIRHDGSTTFRIAYRVLRECPPAGGLAAATETIDAVRGVGARALAAAERVCDAAGYSGLANVEFYGQDDGELCLVEVNPRVWGSVWLPERLGLEPVERAVEQALGHPPRPPLPYTPGRRFHRPTLELRWLLSRSPERGPRRQLLGSVRPWDVWDVLSFTDPKPLALAVRAFASGPAGGLSRRLRRARR